MEMKKLWENTESNPEYTNVCDVYGAEHLARLIGTSTPDFLQISLTDLSRKCLSLSCWRRPTWISSPCHASAKKLASSMFGWDVTAKPTSPTSTRLRLKTTLTRLAASRGPVVKPNSMFDARSPWSQLFTERPYWPFRAARCTMTPEVDERFCHRDPFWGRESRLE